MDHPLRLPSVSMSRLPNHFPAERDMLGKRQVWLRAHGLFPLPQHRAAGAAVHIASKLNRLFGFHLGSTNIGDFKAGAAENYKGTYDTLVKRLCSGRLLHADETKINVRDKGGFVWVFANMEEVAYVYSETREGDLLHTMLKDFKGVLVSDFYAAYDSIHCPQQKCLVHLIRDLNDDVLKHPYDKELKQVALAFTVLLKPMV